MIELLFEDLDFVLGMFLGAVIANIAWWLGLRK